MTLQAGISNSMSRKYFGTDGIRGQANKFPMTPEVAMKVGMAAGIFFSGVILQATGFDAALGANQTEHAIFNIRFYLAVIPIVGLIIAFLALLRFGLTPQRMAEIRAQLEARRGVI